MVDISETSWWTSIRDHQCSGGQHGQRDADSHSLIPNGSAESVIGLFDQHSLLRGSMGSI